MPLDVDARPSPRAGVASARRSSRDPIIIGLVNNMPDSALEATENQFGALLRAAAGPLPVRLRLSYLPEVQRGESARARLEQAYWPLEELQQEPVDALIVTGTEPLAPHLTDEPYWESFVRLLEWAKSNTASSIWSCLAAHAAVQHLDGIQRRRLESKRFGVFEHVVAHAPTREHLLMSGVGDSLNTPHSRWNDLAVAELRAAGYSILSSSDQTGADIFSKFDRSLLIFLQGHLEYEDVTLFKEYRRDVGRYLRSQQSHYPNVPLGYFSAEARGLLEAFKTQALARRAEELLRTFPSGPAAAGTSNTWSVGATRIYANWLAFVAQARQPARAVG